MTLTEAFKLSFTAGEIAPELLGRGDLRAYENGAKTLRNVTILPTGGVTEPQVPARIRGGQGLMVTDRLASRGARVCTIWRAWRGPRV